MKKINTLTFIRLFTFSLFTQRADQFLHIYQITRTTNE